MSVLYVFLALHVVSTMVMAHAVGLERRGWVFALLWPLIAVVAMGTMLFFWVQDVCRGWRKR
jgi:hypothetical protein